MNCKALLLSRSGVSLSVSLPIPRQVVSSFPGVGEPKAFVENLNKSIPHPDFITSQGPRP